MNAWLVGALAGALALGCSHSVHQLGIAAADDIPPGAKVKRIEAEAEQHVVLYITDNTDYADDALRDLVAQCKNGRVVAVESRHSTSHGFLSHDNQLKLSGLCLEEAVDARKSAQDM